MTDNFNQLTLPSAPTNLIYTGVAGTGKTHRLLTLQRLYDEVVASSWSAWRLQQLRDCSWCDVVCAILLLEDRLMSVPEIMQHPLLKDKATANARQDNISQTIWLQLNSHAHPQSATVKSRHRSANYYFDKTESSHWYILPEAQAMLSTRLADLIALEAKGTASVANAAYHIERSCLVSFHQAYGYDEFVEGIRPHINAQTGQMQYQVQDGAFLALCAKASADPEHRYAMLIDEINRANTAQVFGELMSVIEPSKRAGSLTPMRVRLAYSGRQFSVPANVDIYATMNTQDHALATLDTAFRRRFEFVHCTPDAALVGSVTDATGQEVDLATMMTRLNQRLAELLGEEAQLGQAYFMNLTHIAHLARRLHRQIIPQIIHQLTLTAPPAQHYALLLQILYGTTTMTDIIARIDTIDSTDTTNKIDGCLLDTTLAAATSLSGTSASGATPINLVDAFIKVANMEMADTQHDVDSAEVINDKVVGKKTIEDQLIKDKLIKNDNTTAARLTQLFLSATPYQMLYKHH